MLRYLAIALLLGLLVAAPAVGRHLLTGRDLAANTLTWREIGPGAVRSSELRDGSVRLRDLHPSARIAGPRGERGSPGEQGPAGPPGPAAAEPDTYTGVVGGTLHATSGGADPPTMLSLTASFPRPLRVSRDATAVAPTPECSGTWSAPTAAAGWVCVYVRHVLNASAIRAHPVGSVGVALLWQPDTAGMSRVIATWAASP